MKVLQIIHGYPMLFNAGSEIYTQTLCQGLASENIEVAVFTKEEDLFKPEYTIRTTSEFINDKEIKIYLINVARVKDRYVSKGIDDLFLKVLEEFKPDIAHIQNLSHLSFTIVDILHQHSIPFVFTLHDFFLACTNGQFLQVNYGMDNPYALCDGQEDTKCAIHCYTGLMSGTAEFEQSDINYWSSWYNKRQKLVASIVKYTNVFISPSHTVLERLKLELAIPDKKLTYLDYGLDHKRLSNRNRSPENKFVFGYIGTHIVAKGIDLLIKAFAKLDEPAILRIWGRKRGDTTPYLENLVKNLSLPDYLSIEWLPEYNNQNIITEVFNHTDAIVVPSIWLENSPLVIHEALQARVLVITAAAGGMAEYIKDKENGLLFKHRDVGALASTMKFALDNPELMKKLASRGYLQSPDTNIFTLHKHTQDIISIYNTILNK